MFQEENLPYEIAEEFVKGGRATAKRAAWANCKIIRLWNVGDADYVDLNNTDGVIMEECDEKICDCKIGVYFATDEDAAAEDWIVFEAD